jgi:hypothetical protein
MHETQLTSSAAGTAWIQLRVQGLGSIAGLRFLFVPQATLANLRTELESSQSSLFEFTTRQEQAACANNPSGLLPHDCFPVLQISSFAPQATLASLRVELESSQSTLFEFTTRQEQTAGSASTAEQLAVEEVERLSADLLTLRKDKALLERQLQTLQQQQQQQQQADGAGADVNSSSQRLSTVGGGADGADSAVADRQQQESAAAEAALAAAEEAARDQQHQIALLTTKLAAAEGRLERVTGELARRPAASAVAAMAEQLAALSALTGVLGGVLGLGASVVCNAGRQGPGAEGCVCVLGGGGLWCGDGPTASDCCADNKISGSGASVGEGDWRVVAAAGCVCFCCYGGTTGGTVCPYRCALVCCAVAYCVATLLS